VTAPDGSPSTVLTEAAHAPDPAAAAEPPKTETSETTTPFDVSKLTFPEELGKPDEGILNEFGEVAKSLNLTQDGAQKLADLHTKVLRSASAINRFIAKVVSALTEGGIVQGEPGQARQPRSAAQAMYPGLKSEAGD
jgi:hypothetical protein